MKRHSALRALSHDHHHGLVQAHRLMMASNNTAQEALAVAEAFKRFVHQELMEHFRKEEEILIKALKPYCEVESDVQCRRLLSEHEALRQDIKALAAAQGAISMRALQEIGARLEAHIRFEEREFFPRIEALLTEVEMQELLMSLA